MKTYNEFDDNYYPYSNYKLVETMSSSTIKNLRSIGNRGGKKVGKKDLH